MSPPFKGHTSSLVSSLKRSSIFNSKRSWPNPELSIGRQCSDVGSLHCWEVVGPALEVMEKVAKPIADLLDRNLERIVEREDKPRAISFNIWMVGPEPELSEPTLVLASRSLHQRRFAKALIKESKLLDEHNGVKIKTLEKMPAVYRSRQDVMKEHERICFDEIYQINGVPVACGAPISLGGSKRATLGGIVKIGNSYYGLTAQHSRYTFVQEPEQPQTACGSISFDEDSDAEDDEDITCDVTSRESFSSESDSDYTTTIDLSLDSESIFDFARPSLRPAQNNVGQDDAHSAPGLKLQLGNKISTFLPNPKANDLDWEVFPLDLSTIQLPNTISVPADVQRQGSHTLLPRRVIKAVPEEAAVYAATGTTGCVKGIILRSPYYIKMTESQTFQEMWQVQLDRETGNFLYLSAMKIL